MDYFSKANVMYNSKDYEKAITFYERALDEDSSNSASCYYNSSVCHIKLKKYPDAIYLLKKAIRLREESKYYFNLAYCYALLGNNKDALYFFNKAWCLNESDEDCEKAINLLLKKEIDKTKKSY